jgi:hypothetical protein
MGDSKFYICWYSFHGSQSLCVLILDLWTIATNLFNTEAEISKWCVWRSRIFGNSALQSYIDLNSSESWGSMQMTHSIPWSMLRWSLEIWKAAVKMKISPQETAWEVRKFEPPALKFIPLSYDWVYPHFKIVLLEIRQSRFLEWLMYGGSGTK